MKILKQIPKDFSDKWVLKIVGNRKKIIRKDVLEGREYVKTG